MIIIIVSALLLIFGILLLKKKYIKKFSIEVVCTVICALAMITLCISLILLPLFYFSAQSEIKQYYVIKEAIKTAKDSNINEAEQEAITSKITEINNWLANNKYWNKTIFDIYYPDEIEQLEPLK